MSWAPPHRMLIVWNIHNFGRSLAEAQRIHGHIHRDVERARAEPQATESPHGDFTLKATARGRRSRADLHLAAVTRLLQEFMPDAPSRCEAATRRPTPGFRVDPPERVGNHRAYVSPAGEAQHYRPRHFGPLADGLRRWAARSPRTGHATRPDRSGKQLGARGRLGGVGGRLRYGRGLPRAADGSALAAQADVARGRALGARDGLAGGRTIGACEACGSQIPRQLRR